MPHWTKMIPAVQIREAIGDATKAVNSLKKIEKDLPPEMQGMGKLIEEISQKLGDLSKYVQGKGIS